MLHGFDISRHNGINIVAELLTKYPQNTDFFIIKATEGRTYVDPNLHRYAEQVLASGKLLGFYHFCRADNGNKAEDEAYNFVTAVQPYIGKGLLVADFEAESLRYGQKWLLDFCAQVKLLTGVAPIVYLQQSEISKYPDVFKGNYGLWVAKWGTKPTSVSPWGAFALWQYTSRYDGRNLDANYFNGNQTQFLRYCSANNKEEAGKCYCGCSCCSE